MKRLHGVELTDGRPGLSTGTMIVDDCELGDAHQAGSIFHCAREDVDLSSQEGSPYEQVYRPRGMIRGHPTTKAPFRGACVCEERHGRIFCDNFVVFPYLDDVKPGDGGLCGISASLLV